MLWVALFFYIHIERLMKGKAKGVGTMAKKTRIAVLILILLLVGGKLGWDQYEKYQAEQAALILQEQLAEEARLAAEQAAEEEEPQVSFLEVYRQTNPDTVAYLDMPGVSISYPVVQGEDNDHYLHYAFDGSKNYLGSIFLDVANRSDFSDQNTVIYGHNMGKPGMFYELTQYRSQEFLDEHKTFTITLDEQVLTYQIFSIYVTEPDYDYRTVNYPTEEGYQDFLDRIIARSMLASDASVTTADHIITLSTCVYDFNDARMAVHAVLLPGDDSTPEKQTP